MYSFCTKVIATLQNSLSKIRIFTQKDEADLELVINSGRDSATKLIELICRCKSIQYFASFGQTSEHKKKDAEVVRLISLYAMMVGKNKLEGFKKLNEQAVFDTLEIAYNELIGNSQKAIMENLLRDQGIATDILEQCGVHDPKIQLPKEIGLWIQVGEVREMLYVIARKKGALPSIFVEYSANYFSFSVKNNTFFDYATAKKLQEIIKTATEKLKKGENIWEVLTQIQSGGEAKKVLGAGVGTFLTLQAILEIAQKSNVDFNFTPVKSQDGYVVMKAELFLDKPYAVVK